MRGTVDNGEGIKESLGQSAALCLSSRLDLFRISNQVIGRSNPTSGIRARFVNDKVAVGKFIKGVLGVHDEKRVWFEVELQGAQGDREAKVFQVSNDDITVAQRRLKDKQPEEKTNTDCLVKEQKKEYRTSRVTKHLGVAGLQQQNELVDETNVTLFAKVRCFLIQSGLSKVFWVEDITMSTYLVNRSPSSAIGFKKLIDMLGFFGWLASIKQRMHEPVKVKCIFLGYHKSIVGSKLWRLDDVTSKVMLYRNMDFNESREYKKTFIGSGVGTGSMQVLHEFEFEMEPLGDHTFEVKPQENVDQGVGLQEVQTQDLMDYQLGRDREQHLACELFGYREDCNEAAFAVATVEKIYAHESLTFNNTVACEVISKWNAGLKDDMDAQSDVHATKDLLDKAKGNVLGMEIVRDESGNTLRVSQSRFYNGKLVQTLLEGHSILSLEGSLSRDYDVERKLKGLLTESRYELSLVAGIATGALVKGGSRSEVPAQVEAAAYRY
ncbi:hypothetical protein Tco_1086815 [Tanacetum coccineum]